MIVLSWLLRGRNRLIGLDRYDDPWSYFGPGGFPEAEALCAEANRDLLQFVRPPAEVKPQDLHRVSTGESRDGARVEDWSFDSPLPSGIRSNDRVHYRLFLPPAVESPGSVVLFHHPAYQNRWRTWSWFTADLIARSPVAMMAAPHHFQRKETGRFAGEGTCNPNPARMFEALRQWCWDHQAMVAALGSTHGLCVTAEIGYSLGAFQIMLLASAGRIDVPIVSIASTNRYAFGLTHGIVGGGLLRAMRKVGIDRDRLFAMTDSIQLERYAHCLRTRPVLYMRGSRDWVDPAPSLDRLESALRPTRAITLNAGHSNLLLRRRKIFREAIRFLEEAGAL
jgi:pimeloyl-ACP methyl ester carboxylesterase